MRFGYSRKDCKNQRHALRIEALEERRLLATSAGSRAGLALAQLAGH